MSTNFRGFEIRQIVTIIEETRSESGIITDYPLRKVAAAAVIENPYAGAYHEDLSEAVQVGSGTGEISRRKGGQGFRRPP